QAASHLGETLGVWPLGAGHMRRGLDSKLRLHSAGQQFFWNGRGGGTSGPDEPRRSGAANLRGAFHVVFALCGASTESKRAAGGCIAQPAACISVRCRVGRILGRAHPAETAPVSLLI